MTKSKLTLVIDGNWLLMSRMSTLMGKFPNETELMHETKLLMIKSINLVLRQFSKIDNIIFVADGGSWRAKLDIPQYILDDSDMESHEYKGNRHLNEEIDWDIIFNEYERFMTEMKVNGITVCKEQDIEGDDWCWYWSRKLNAEDTNVIIWSQDKDLTQLVETDKNACFTVCWNGKTGMTAKDMVDDDLTSFLLNPYYAANEECYNHIAKKAGGIKKINPLSVQVDKIIRGDMGDNIWPIILKKSKPTSTKSYRVATKDMNFNLDIYNENEVKEYLHNLLESKSYAGKTLHNEETIVKHFFYNRKLVTLDRREYPQAILDILDTYDSYNVSKDLSVVESKIQAEQNKVDSMLDFI